MIDDRARSLLKTLVERYIQDGAPVGSRALSKYSTLELSPATIRNVMADLEELKLVASPHTSAGRVPTPQGYRLFVDSLLTVQPLSLDTHQAMTGQLQRDDPQRVLSKAVQLLSQLSSFAAVVAAPKRSALFKHVEFMGLSDHKVLLIIVTPDGDVQNRILMVDRPYSQADLVQASNYFNQHFSGLSFGKARECLAQELHTLSQDISHLMQAAVDAGDEAQLQGDDAMLLSGEHRLLNVGELATNMDKLRQLFGVFEQRTGLLRLLESSSKARGVQIFIGGDSQLVPMQEMSVISASYTVNGEVVGALGVIGPTRMAYERLIPMVDITARLVSSALSDPEY